MWHQKGQQSYHTEPKLTVDGGWAVESTGADGHRDALQPWGGLVCSGVVGRGQEMRREGDWRRGINMRCWSRLQAHTCGKGPWITAGRPMMGPRGPMGATGTAGRG
jgi:hypothetical protein